VYDDLSKHAQRTRDFAAAAPSPGREAYPGDVFYLHSRLLERAAKLNNSLGGGSLTALPIIETQAGDLSAYIPTNVISITDGQIFLETDLFHQGVRRPSTSATPSRASAARRRFGAMRQVAGSLRLDPRAISRARGVRAVRQRSRQGDTGAAQSRPPSRGNPQQPQYQPVPVEKQVAIIYAATKGYLDPVPVEELRRYEEELYRFLETRASTVLTGIAEKKILDDEIKAKLERRSPSSASSSPAPCHRGLRVTDALTDRSPAPDPRGQIDAADHQGDEDDRPRRGCGARRIASFAARPFAQRMLKVLNGLVSRVDQDAHPLLRIPPQGSGRPLLIVITADRGLCGSFNSNVIKAAGQFILKEAPGRDIALGLIGRKGRDFFAGVASTSGTRRSASSRR